MKKLHPGVSLLLFLSLSGLSIPADPPAIFDSGGAEAMLAVIQAIHDGEKPATVERLFDQAMESDSYRICVRHFTDPAMPASNHVTAAQYKTFIMSLLSGPADTQGNRRLGYMAPLYADALKDPGKYNRAMERLREIPAARIREAFDRARQWLPPGIELKGRVQLVLDMGGGAWIFTDERNVHHVSFNLLALLDPEGRIDKDLFLGTLAHEMHHIGLPDAAFLKAIHYDTLGETSRLKMFVDFISPLIAEGLAQKFCSNAPGVWTGKPYPEEPFAAIAEAKADWTLYMSQLKQIHQHFIRDLEWILEKDVSDPAAFNQAYADYWTWHAGRREGRKSVLGRRYYYGTEMVGLIFKGLGKAALFELMSDYRKLPVLFNRALRAAGPPDGEALRIPGRLIEKIAGLR